MDLKINILIEGIGGGGAERVVAELSTTNIPNTETRVSIFSRRPTDYNVPSVFVFDENQYNIILKLLYKLSPNILYPILSHYLHIKAINPHVSVSFLNYENCINLLVSNILQIPCVISIRNNINTESITTPKSLSIHLESILLRHMSPYLIVNSEYNKNWLIDRYNLDKNKCITVYNPKNIIEIRTRSLDDLNEDFLNTTETMLISVGRLAPQKGHIHLLRIFSNLIKNSPCKLVICGTGKLEESLKRLADDLGVSKSVLFTGWCDNPYKYMKRADIFVFPSLFEGQPNAMIEALICGCPIVSTDCDYGPREILDDGKYGLLTKKLDGKIDNPLTTPLTDAEQDMYDKVLYLMQHPEERERLRQLSSEQIHLFDKERCIKKYYDVFRAAAEGRPLTDIK